MFSTRVLRSTLPCGSKAPLVRVKPRQPRPLRVICGYCPTFGNAVRVTLLDDETVRIERQPIRWEQVSRYDGITVVTGRTFPVLVEPVKNHTHLISHLQQPALWPE